MSSGRIEKALDHLLGVPLKKELSEEEDLRDFVRKEGGYYKDLGDFNGRDLLGELWPTGMDAKDLLALLELLNSSYANVERFFDDNPDCMELIVWWIGNNIDDTGDWRTRIEDAVRDKLRGKD